MPRSTDIDVSIIIPTIRREQLLANLIPRCFAQLGFADGQVEVIVVDNCPLQSAKPMVERLSEKFGPSLRYLSEKRPGVSHVRNVGVRAAPGRIIGFITMMNFQPKPGSHRCLPALRPMMLMSF